MPSTSGRGVAEHLEDGPARRRVRREPRRDDDGPRAQPPRQPAAHRRAHPVRLRLVARREHDPAADDDRPPAQPRVVALLDRRVERVEIGVQDGRLGHEHMFEHDRAVPSTVTDASAASVQRRRGRVARGRRHTGDDAGDGARMAETVGDHVLAAVTGVGGRAGLRLPRRRHQRHRRRVRQGRRLAGVHPGAARGDVGVPGRRLRQVLRQGRRLHGHLRPGRDPPAQRPVRREARPRAGRRDRRADRAQRDGRLLPAGGRPAGAVQGRGERVPRRGQRPRAAAAGDRPRDPDGAVPPRARRRSSSRATCRPSRTARRSTSSSRSRPARRRCTRPTVIARPRRDSPAPPRSSTPGSGSRSWSGRARAVRPTRSRRSRTCSAPASRRRCSARTC